MDNFMDILYLLIPVSIVLVFLIGGLFWWSLRHGQFEDLEGPGYRILMDDDRPITTPVAKSDESDMRVRDKESDNKPAA